MPPPKAIRWLIVVGALIVLTLGILYYNQIPTLEPRQVSLPADGAEHNALRIHLPSFALGSNLTTDTYLRVQPTKDPAQMEGLIQAPVNPGTRELHLRWRNHTLTVPLTFVFDPQDTYSDGTPDFLRLHTTQDREGFRNWFTSIAASQLDQPSPEIQDCAALLRFAYREALRSHDETWLLSHPSQTTRPSVAQYSYPQTPLGANLFRVRAGPFVPEDLRNGSFAQFADAQTLMERNTYLVGRDLRIAHPGDLIFYRQLDQQSPYDVPDVTHYHSPFHSMIFCGESGVVYHTGPIHHGKGEMRRLLVSDLLHHPDARWRPLPENSNFLGVYRWNILREGD